MKRIFLEGSHTNFRLTLKLFPVRCDENKYDFSIPFFRFKMNYDPEDRRCSEARNLYMVTGEVEHGIESDADDEQETAKKTVNKKLKVVIRKCGARNKPRSNFCASNKQLSGVFVSCKRFRVWTVLFNMIE